MPTVHYVSRALLSENGLHSLQWSDPLANNNNDGNDDDLNWRAVTGDVPRKLNYPSEFASKSTVAQGKKDGTSITSSTSSFLAPHVADIAKCRQILADIACRCDTQEAPTYPIYVNYSRQVQVSPNIRVSYPP